MVNEVLLIPSFKFNLLSISKLSLQYNSNIFFTPTKCILQNSQKNDIILGNLVDGLYQLVPETIISSSCSLSVISYVNLVISSSLWHQRLGHIPTTVLLQISDLEVPKNSVLPHCTVCPQAKQCKLPFPTSSSQAGSAFDLIHCDVWGPYKSVTHSGCNYFLTILDDHTRALWTILLPTKQHVIQSMQDFHAYVFTQFQTLLKCIRTDNWGGGICQS